MECVISAALLSIGVAAVGAMQLKTVPESMENLRRVEAMHMAKTFADRTMQSINPSWYGIYLNDAWSYGNYFYSTHDCLNKLCSLSGQSGYDLNKLTAFTKGYGYRITGAICPNNPTRGCVFVAWNATTAWYGDAETDCASIKNGRLVVNERAYCVVLEGYVL